MGQVYAVFRSRTQALDCAARLKRFGIAAQAVSSPREANAGCGLSARFAEADFPRARKVVERRGIPRSSGIAARGRGISARRSDRFFLQICGKMVCKRGGSMVK